MKILERLEALLVGVVLFFCSVAGGFCVCGVALAEETPRLRLQLSPAKMDIEDLRPGEVREVSFRVQNTGTDLLKYEIEISPYNVIDENYTQDFSKETNYTDITKWISFSQDSGEVEPDKEDVVAVTIKVPVDVPAGGQYAAIMVRIANEKNTNHESEGAAISTISQVGTIIYANVTGGKTRKEGKVIENKVPSFKFQPPVTASSVVENTGNVHATATYTLQVFPLFGGEEVYSNEDKPDTRTILPETKRYNEIQWEGAPALGIFKVKQTVNFLGQDSVTEKVVFLCPIWFLFIILLLIFVIIFWIINRVRGRRAF